MPQNIVLLEPIGRVQYELGLLYLSVLWLRPTVPTNHISAELK